MQGLPDRVGDMERARILPRVQYRDLRQQQGQERVQELRGWEVPRRKRRARLQALPSRLVQFRKNAVLLRLRQRQI